MQPHRGSGGMGDGGHEMGAGAAGSGSAQSHGSGYANPQSN